jgi:acyl-CoA synthetase (AMP-forming)/AMP-acid ligase II
LRGIIPIIHTKSELWEGVMKQGTLLWHYLEKWAAERPEKEALVFGEKRITYKEFYDTTVRTAKLLLHLGVKKGDRIFTLSAARDEWLYHYMAAGMVGAIWYGLNPRYTKDEFLYQVGDAKPSIGFVVRWYDLLQRDYKDDMLALREAAPDLKHMVVIGEAWEGALSWDEEIKKDRPELDAELKKRMAEVAGDEPTLIIYTSGTTGKPKGALLTHRNIIAAIEVETKHFLVNHKPGEGRFLLHFPINHVAGAVEIAFAGIYGGLTLVLMDRFDPVATMATVAKEKITLLGQVPAMFLLEFKLPDYDSYDLSSIRNYLWAGSAAPEGMVKRLAATGATLITGYGQTENAGFITYSKPGDPIDDLVKTVGKCDDAFQIKLMDNDGKEVPMGEVGEIWMKGDLVMKGYWNRPEATAETIVKGGWLRSGDLATIDERGYITVVGRTKEMFKSGGYNVYPREIEAVIERHPNVAFVTIVPIPDETWQEVGKAFIMPVPGTEIKEEELRELCKKHLANYKVPKEFEVRPFLPLLPTGKINRLALVEEERKKREGKA